MSIKIKNRDPKKTDFASDEIVINRKEGTLFFKSDKNLIKLEPSTSGGSNATIPDGTYSSSLQTLGDITSSGAITLLKDSGAGIGDHNFIRFSDTQENFSYALGVHDGTVNTFRLAYDNNSADAFLGNSTQASSNNINVSNDIIVITPLLSDNTGGNVGIGTDLPDASLEVLRNNANAEIAVTRQGDTQMKLKAQDNKTRVTYEGGPLLFDRDESGTNTLKLDSNGNISASGNIVNVTTGSFGRIECLTISSSTGDFDASTIRIGGEAFNRANLIALKEGKTIQTSSRDLAEGDSSVTNISRVEAIMSADDAKTFIKMKGSGRTATFISGTLFQDLQKTPTKNLAQIGDGNTNLLFSGSIVSASINGGFF